MALKGKDDKDGLHIVYSLTKRNYNLGSAQKGYDCMGWATIETETGLSVTGNLPTTRPLLDSDGGFAHLSKSSHQGDGIGRLV